MNATEKLDESIVLALKELDKIELGSDVSTAIREDVAGLVNLKLLVEKQQHDLDMEYYEAEVNLEKLRMTIQRDVTLAEVTSGVSQKKTKAEKRTERVKKIGAGASKLGDKAFTLISDNLGKLVGVSASVAIACLAYAADEDGKMVARLTIDTLKRFKD